MSELKPCPRCKNGGRPRSFELNGYPDTGIFVVYKIWCIDCNLSTWTYEFLDESVEAWNTRPIEDALRAELAEAKARNARLVEAATTLRKAQHAYGELQEVPITLRDGGWQEKVKHLNDVAFSAGKSLDAAIKENDNAD